MGLFLLVIYLRPNYAGGLPCGSAGKESACSAGDLGSIPGLGRSLQKGTATTPICWPGEFHGLYSLWHRKESDMTELLSISPEVSLVNAYFLSLNLIFP